ncbi:MAG: hypothetical protein P1P89_17205 [Desulfobacterales bacterium]|nr:hypothetical protein [Desulfobacterales bacterium]
MKYPNHRIEQITDAVLLAGVTAFLMVYFDVRYLFFNTVVTGGDTASWQGVAHHLARELLPRGQLTGWDMGNFCGYPNFSFYFLPPFLLAALPAKLFNIPLSITLKWAIMSGIYFFPVAVYAGLRRMQYRFPVPVMGAGGAVLILFNEAYTMFGGNALSTFAGEFCYMFAFALLALFIGHYYTGEKTRTRATANGILLGLIGLSHLFVFIPAVTILLAIFLMTGRIRYPLKVGLTAAALMAFWLLPLITFRHPFTTPVYMIWQEFVTLRHVMAGVFIIVVLMGPRLALTGLRRSEKITFASATAAPLVFALGAAALVYLASKYLTLGTGLFYSRLAIPDHGASTILIRTAAQRLDAYVLPLAVVAGLATAFLGINACRSGSMGRQGFYCRAGSISLLMVVLSGVWGLYSVIVPSVANESIRGFLLNPWTVRLVAAAAATALGTVLFFSNRHRDRLLQAAETAGDERFVVWLALIAGSLVVYFSAHFLEVPDIRFLPPVLFALVMILIAETPGPFMAESRTAVKVLAALTVVYVAVTAAIFGAQKADGWFRYNNRGYELAGGYEDFRAVNQYLRTSYPDRDALNAPRVAYEKCDLYGPYGGDRVFESLPYFSGRQTLEGIHYAGALGSRSIAFLQTEFSQEVKTPGPLILSRINPAVLPAHFDLYNISQVVVMTKSVGKALSASPYFTEEASFGPIKLFRYTRSQERYVDVPAVRPVLYKGSRWADDFFSLFKESDRADMLLVPRQFVTDRDDRAVFGGTTDSFRDLESYRRNRLDRDGTEIETRLSHHEIRFKTNRVGLPHLIKVSYFPNWKVRGARGVYPVSPHFMLVIPRETEVVLTYGRTGWDIAGIGITWGWVLLLLGTGIFRLGAKTLSGGVGRIFHRSLCRIDGGLDRLESHLGCNRQWIAGLVIVVSFGIALSGAFLRNRPVRIYEAGYRAFQEGMALSAQNRAEAAPGRFQRGIAIMAPLLDRRARVDHRDVIHAMIATAMCHENLGDIEKARYWYGRIIAEYPFSRFVGESHVKTARLYRQQAAPLLERFGSELRRGQAAAAQQSFREGVALIGQSLDHYGMAVRLEPYSAWAEYAREDLAGVRIYLLATESSLPAGLDDSETRRQLESIKARLEQVFGLLN